MIEIFARVAYLFALVIAPRVPSPDPLDLGFGLAAIGVLLLAIGPLVSGALARSYDALEAKFAFGLWLLADAAVLFEAVSTAGRGAPLLAGYYVAGPFVWAALAATAATLAGQYLGVSFKNKRMGAAIATLAIAIFVFRDASAYIASEKEQWRAALVHDPDHERALMALGNESPIATLDACIARRPTACTCRVLRAELALDAERAEAAVQDLAQATCAGHALEARSNSARALGFAMSGRGDEAGEVATATLADHPDDSRALFAMAIVESRAVHYDAALDFAQRAAERGAGRGAELLITQLLITQGKLDEAKKATSGFLDRHPDDPDGVYNQALIADRSNRYNEAREGYLKALKLRPGLANARYNLALLTLRHGMTEEARNHIRKFVEAFPDDPRGAGLQARVAP